MNRLLVITPGAVQSLPILQNLELSGHVGSYFSFRRILYSLSKLSSFSSEGIRTRLFVPSILYIFRELRDVPLIAPIKKDHVSTKPIVP